MKYITVQTESFQKWLKSLRDFRAATAVVRRIDRAREGNLGDYKSVGNGVSEMRIDVGAGYRIYFTIRDRKIIFFVHGGDKSTQPADIKKAAEKVKGI